jgi:hypothetical protein
MSSLVIRVKENSWVARFAAFKLGTENVAIVVGNTIHLWNCTKEDFLKNPKWLRHELCHVEQFQRYGFMRFIFRYLWESLRKGYRNNKFEREARDSENTAMPDARVV